MQADTEMTCCSLQQNDLKTEGHVHIVIYSEYMYL